jgi:xylulokinase
MGDEYLLTIDVGTTTTRCILFDLAGTPVAEAFREPEVYHPRINWTEAEPEDWWKATVAVIRDVLDQTATLGAPILGVGLCGLQHALVPIDRHGNPLSRSILWMDQRCQAQVDWLNREHCELIRKLQDADAALSTTYSAPKLRWLVENQPDLVRQTHKFLPAKDFIRFRLTGTLATDPYDAAGTWLLDRQTGQWSHEMLQLVGVPPDKMPPIHDATQVVGGVTSEAAGTTGLRSGTPVIVGSGDVLCTRMGANASDSGRACLYLGTAAWVSIPRPDTRNRTIKATATTGAALKWVADLLETGDLRPTARPADGSPYAALTQQAERVPAGSRGLIFLPHLMGERGPEPDPEARGVLFGLTLAHDRADITRAVLEGSAFQLRRILESCGLSGPGEMVAVGGGAKSALWLDIIADVTGLTLLVPRVVEAGALGAAILAGVGVGVYPDIREASHALVHIKSQHAPDGVNQDLYHQIFQIFLDLENRVAPLYGKLPFASQTA